MSAPSRWGRDFSFVLWSRKPTFSFPWCFWILTGNRTFVKRPGSPAGSYEIAKGFMKDNLHAKQSVFPLLCLLSAACTFVSCNSSSDYSHDSWYILLLVFKYLTTKLALEIPVPVSRIAIRHCDINIFKRIVQLLLLYKK